MYEVIGSAASRTFRVLWMLEELGEPYRHFAHKPRSEAVSALNPLGKIPMLRDGDAVLTDSSAILAYLADKHGRLTHPAGTIARARQDGLLHMILDEIDAVLWTSARHSFVLPEEQRVPQVKDSLRWEFARNVAHLGDVIDGPFLMGDEMTVPDIVATHCINWARNARFEITDRRVLDYAREMRARPAFQRAAALLEAK